METLGDKFNPKAMPDVRAGGLTCNGKTGSNAGHRAGELADNKKTRHYEKRVSGTAVSQLSFLQIINIFLETDTRVKMQISYSLINASVEDADWDAQLGYCYAYLFELNKHSFKAIHMRKYL